MADHIRKSTDPNLPGWRLRVSRETNDSEIDIIEEVVHPEQVDNPEARFVTKRERIRLSPDETRWLRNALDKELAIECDEVERLQRTIKYLRYYEIHDDAITILTNELTRRAAGTELELICADAVTNITQLIRQRDEARAERDKP